MTPATRGTTLVDGTGGRHGAVDPRRAPGRGTTGAIVPDPVPRAQVAEMARALDFYLGLGCEVRRATDGWVLLGCGAVSFVLVTGTASDTAPEVPTPAGTPWVRLRTPDVRALRWRLLGDGVSTSVVLRPTHHSPGEIRVVDPDRRTVVIQQLGDGCPPAPEPRP